MKTTICCVAGRSGGHIIPCLIYAQTLLKTDSTEKILFFSSNTPLDINLPKQFDTIEKQIILPLGNVPGRKITRYPTFLWQLVRSFWLALRNLLLRKTKPRVIISTGGYISIPVCLVGWMLRIPIELFELNATPGKAISFLARFATTIHVCFPETQKYFPSSNTVVTAYPVRDALKQVTITQEEVLTNLGFSPEKKTILVLGGSQGSHSLNRIMESTIKMGSNLSDTIQIIHQTGNEAPQELEAFYKAHGITACVFQFSNTLETLYPAADLVICRAGAGSLFETLFFKKKCIIIPLETKTTDHQLDNAVSCAKSYPQYCTVLRQQAVMDDPQMLTQYL